MRTLGEIIELVKSGGRPEYEELRYALVAISLLGVKDSMAFGTLFTAERQGHSRGTKSSIFQAERHHERWKEALNTDPKTWIGNDHDPDNQECQRFRKLAFKIWVKAENGDLKKQDEKPA